MHNPNVTEGAKEHAKEVLDNEFDGGNVDKEDDKNPAFVAAGLKGCVAIIVFHVLTANDFLHRATHNPLVSDEAKKNAQERLNEME